MRNNFFSPKLLSIFFRSRASPHRCRCLCQRRRLLRQQTEGEADRLRRLQRLKRLKRLKLLKHLQRLKRLQHLSLY